MRHEQASYHVKINLPETIGSLLRQYLGTKEGQSLTYLLVSDTDERALRAFFPTSAVEEKLIHLGFYHDDIPGALYAILRALARARFNIVASLLRKHKASRNVWEAVLEYRGKNFINLPLSGKELCDWVATNLIEVADNPLELKRCNIEIGLPLYPKYSSGWRGSINFNERLILDNAQELIPKNINELLNERKKAIAQPTIDPDKKKRVSDLITTVSNRVAMSDTPTLFISYPRIAERHAEMVKKKLHGKYQILDYVLPDGEIILDEVVRRILSCTYFIGIWHHDDTHPTDGGKYNISPWMPFEYGIAISANKHAIVIHSELLDERVWKRINPGVSHPQYSDIYFSQTLEILDDYCYKHMK